MVESPSDGAESAQNVPHGVDALDALGAHQVDLHRSASWQMAGCGPTVKGRFSLCIEGKLGLDVKIPRSSADHRGRCACCAFHDKHHQHHDGSHTPRMRSCVVVSGVYGTFSMDWYLQSARRGAWRRDVTADKTSVPSRCVNMLFESRAGRRRASRGREVEVGAEEGVRVDSWTSQSLSDVPFEFEGEIASACAMAEAGDIESGAAAARHVCVVSRRCEVTKRRRLAKERTFAIEKRQVHKRRYLALNRI